MQFGPQFVFGDAGLQRRFHLAHGRLAGNDGAAHGKDLVRRLDETGVLHHGFAIADADAEPREFLDAFRVEVVDGDPAVAAAVLGDEVGDAGGPAAHLMLGQLAAVEIHPRHGRAHLVDDAGMIGQMLAGEIVEQHHRPLGGDEAMPGRIVRDPELHVGRIRRVADVDGVVEQGAGVVAPFQLGADALEPVFSHRRQVGGGNTRRRPFAFSLGAVAQHMLVERSRLFARSFAQRFDGARLEGNDLAVAAEAAA